MKNILCFIPARKGSKGIKNKNLIRINKKPLIYYTLRQAYKLKKTHKVEIKISTDSKNILNYAKRNFKYKFDYLRPSKLAKDKSNVIDAVFHSLSWFKKKNINFDTIILLQPTNPLRFENEIKNSLNLFFKKKLSSLMSVTPIREHPSETIKLSKTNWKYLVNPPKNHGRQNFAKNYYFIDGTIFIVKNKFLQKNKKFILSGITYPYILQRTWPVDIDYYDDKLIAETFIKKNKIG